MGGLAFLNEMKGNSKMSTFSSWVFSSSYHPNVPKPGKAQPFPKKILGKQRPVRRSPKKRAFSSWLYLVSSFYRL